MFLSTVAGLHRRGANLAMSTGQSPALYTLPVVFTALCAFLPLDAVSVLTYARGLL